MQRCAVRAKGSRLGRADLQVNVCKWKKMITPFFAPDVVLIQVEYSILRVKLELSSHNRLVV